MNIKKAITSDVDAIHALGNTENEFNVSDEVVTFWPKHILFNIIDSKIDLLLIAEDKNEIIGFIIINNNLVFNKAIVENIFVSPQFREQGVAKKLLDVAMDMIGTTGCKYICALTSNDKAISFYKSNGFKKGRNFAWLDKVLSKEFRKT